MDVDYTPSTSGTGIMSSPTQSLPKIDEDSGVNQKSAKQKITEILDLLEGKVEKLRKEAARLEEDKDTILASLDSVRTTEWINELGNFEQDETQRYIDRIIDRCLTVDIKIHTQRDQPQEEALHQVNHLIDALVVTLKTDADGARDRCISYMNACASNNVYGMVDKKFENALLGCTLDDQKRVKKRLQGLLSYLEKLDVQCEGKNSEPVVIFPEEISKNSPTWKRKCCEHKSPDVNSMMEDESFAKIVGSLLKELPEGNRKNELKQTIINSILDFN